MRGSNKVLLVAALTAAVAGCMLGEGDADDLIYLHNTTDTTVTVTHEASVNGTNLVFTVTADFGPSQLGFVSQARFDDNKCLSGKLVARADDVVVDEIAGLCRPVRWEIGAP